MKYREKKIMMIIREAAVQPFWNFMRKEIYFHRNINLLQNIISVFQLLIKYIGGGTCPSYQTVTTGLLPLKVNLISSDHNDCLF